MKRKLFGLSVFMLVSLFAITACSSDDTAQENESAQEANTTTENVEDIKELVHAYSTGKKEAERASITSHQLIVTEKDGTESTYDLPEDEFFLSIAPYINQTHE